MLRVLFTESVTSEKMDNSLKSLYLRETRVLKEAFVKIKKYDEPSSWINDPFR